MRRTRIFEDFSLNAINVEETLARARDYIDGRKIIVYGAAMIGADLFRALRDLRFNVSHIVDKNALDIDNIDGFRVSAPDIIKDIAPTADYVAIIGAGEQTAASIIEYISSLEVDLTVIENGRFLADCLKIVLCAMNHAAGQDKSHAVCSECSVLDTQCPILRVRGRDIRNIALSRRTTSIGYILSNNCTLRCRFCDESVPKYSERSFVPVPRIMRDIAKVASVSEFITIAEFIGGEPFLHKGLPDIIRFTLSIQNIGFVRIFTNGTVLPSDELLAALKDKRAAVYVSNYTGFLTPAQEKAVEACKEALARADVSWLYGVDKKWNDMSSYNYHPEDANDPGALSDRFNNCIMHCCNRICDGVLYVCPHHYAGIRLGLIPTTETVELHNLSDEDLVKAMEALKALPYADACRYCDMPYNAAPIYKPGIQEKYERYLKDDGVL